MISHIRHLFWGTRKVTQQQYREHGTYDDSTIRRRFKSWNNALELAGLKTSNRPGLKDEELFENILVLWQHYGRQPRRNELGSPPSKLSQSPYNRRFGSWSDALKAFVEYANSAGELSPSTNEDSSGTRRTGRDPSLRLRWRVLQRDSFKCVACSASPAITPGIELHVDHIQAWSRGGETVIENLQTLCSKCNLGKSNE